MMLWFLIQRVQNDRNFNKAQFSVLSRLIQNTSAKSAKTGLSLRLQLVIKCYEPGLPSWEQHKNM